MGAHVCTYKRAYDSFAVIMSAHISASPTAFLFRGYGRAEAVILSTGTSIPAQYAVGDADFGLNLAIIALLLSVSH